MPKIDRRSGVTQKDSRLERAEREIEEARRVLAQKEARLEEVTALWMAQEEQQVAPHTSMRTCLRACRHARVCTRVCTHVYTHVYTHVCTHIYTHGCTQDSMAKLQPDAITIYAITTWAI